ncbi:MAG: class I SAM-dependent methyltransferase [Isosphaeraceae bacterium]
MVARGSLAHGIEFCRKLRMQLTHFKNEVGQVFSDAPQYAGTGLIGQIVPPIAATSLRANVGSPSLVGNLFVADAWYLVLSRFIRENSIVLDIGCGCGKMARTLVYHPYIEQYIGFDVIRENIDWCQRSIVPLSRGRFEFHYFDVFSRAYNPTGTVKGTDVAFPVDDGAVDFAFAGSVFTHLLEEDARRYLREVRRALSPDGIFLPSIHTSPLPGSAYSGTESRIDIDCEYFVKLAQAAGLRLVERLGALCGQETFLFGVS